MVIPNWFKYFLVLTLIHCFLLAGAQSFNFSQYGIEEGLPSNKVFMARESREGFVWVATENGVVRFDGKELKTYTLDKIEDIKKRTFVSLFLDIDADNTIWLISNNGLLFHYDPALDRFVFDSAVNPEGNIYVGDFLVDRGRFMIGSYNGLFVYDPEEEKLQHVPGIESNVSSIIKSNDGRYFIGTRNGVFQVNSTLDQVKDISKDSHGTWFDKDQKVESLYFQSSESKLWIGLEKDGIYSYNVAHNEIQKVEISAPPIDVPVRSIVDFVGGTIMIGTDGGGIIQYDTFNEQVVNRFSYNEDHLNALSSNAIYDIFLNSQGIMLVSTYRGGLNIYNPHRQQFGYYKHIRGESNSLKNDVVPSIAEPGDGLLSFGTDKGISFLDTENDSWKHLSIDGNEQSAKSAVVFSQSVGSDGDLWAASFIYSLTHIGISNNQFKVRSDLPDLPENFRVKRVFANPHGELLLGGINSGLFVVYPDGETKEFNITEPLDIEAYAHTRVLISSRDGLAMMDLERETLDWISQSTFKEVLEDKIPVSLQMDLDRKLWVGTLDKGLYQLDFENGSAKKFGIQEGMASDNIFDLQCDTENNIWVATAVGLSKVSNGEIVNFYKSDGLISTDFNRNAALKSQDGKLYFGTNNGVIVFNPANIENTSIDKKLLFTDFYLNHERIVAGEQSILENPLNETDELDLAYNQNSFSIGFASIDFMHPDLGKYSWKLEGFDDDWVAGENLDRATYTNLNPGEYTFRVRLVDQLGQVLSPEASLKLMIDQPFWKTPFAFVIYMLFIMGLVALLLYSNRLRMETKNAAERLHFLIEMAHEIKTPLTLIRAPLTDLIKKESTDNETKESLEVALNSADKLHKQMMQFLDFRRINIRKGSLEIASINLVDFIQHKVFAFKVLADKKHIQLTFDYQQEELIINCDEKILDKIISNLISNAIKYTNDGGKVSLNLNWTEKKWNLSVLDTGIGIPKKDQKKIFTLFYRTQTARNSGSTGSGVGLVLASDLAKTLGGTVKLVSSDEQGTEFAVTMPLDKFTPTTIKIEPEKEVEVVEQESAAASKLKILIVEDDPDLRNYQKHKFEHKYQIKTAGNGEDALEMIAQDLPDLIISDVMMPKMNGRQLCMNVKTNVATSHIPVILLTGMESKEAVQQGLESGADDYIIKPFDFDILSSKIENLLQTRAAFKQKFVHTEEEYQYQDLSNELDQQFLDDITKMVEDNISDPDLSVNYLCQTLGMSRTSFYHKLKALVDLSPAEFIRTIRLKKARKMLLNPSNNISEVAYSTGFSDAKYFSTLFKKYYGQSPSTFVAEKKEEAKKQG